jgi:hypothetical protein
MRSLFLQNANQKLQGFLPYHTNKYRSTFFGDFFWSVGRFFWLRSLLVWKSRNPCNFRFAFWEKRWPHKFILNLTDLYIKHVNDSLPYEEKSKCVLCTINLETAEKITNFSCYKKLTGKTKTERTFCGKKKLAQI